MPSNTHHIGMSADSLSLPRNPLIDGNVHHGTARNIVSMLEFIASGEDIHTGTHLALITVYDAARYLAKALEPTP